MKKTKKQVRIQAALDQHLYEVAKKTMIDNGEKWQSLLPRLIEEWTRGKR